MDVLTIRSAACVSSIRPIRVDPVNEGLRTRGSTSAVSTSSTGWSVVSTFTVPAAAPASASSCAIDNAVSGVSSAGLRTNVHPAASAGPIFRVAIAAGKFYDVSNRHTPIGLRKVRIRFAPEGAVRNSPPTRAASSASQRKRSAA